MTMKSFAIPTTFRGFLVVPLVLRLLPVEVDGALTSLPTNQVAFSGDQVNFECGTNLSRPVSWSQLGVSGTIADTLYINGKLVNSKMNLRVAVSPDRHDIIVTSVRPSDAGQYTCRDNNGRAGEQSADAQLAVLLHRNMTCGQNLTDNVGVVQGQVVRLECHFVWTGNLVLTTSWSAFDGIPTGGHTSSGIQTDADGVTYNRVLSYVDVTAGTDGIGLYNCTVGFAPSLLDYRQIYSWTSAAIPSSFAVRNITINSTSFGTYDRGQVLTCSAEGYPPPSYRWLDVVTNDVILDGNHLILDVEGNHSYRCVATNTIQNKSFSTECEIRVQVSPGTPQGHVTVLPHLLDQVSSGTIQGHVTVPPHLLDEVSSGTPQAHVTVPPPAPLLAGLNMETMVIGGCSVFAVLILVIVSLAVGLCCRCRHRTEVEADTGNGHDSGGAMSKGERARTGEVDDGRVYNEIALYEQCDMVRAAEDNAYAKLQRPHLAADKQLYSPLIPGHEQDISHYASLYAEELP